MPNHLKFYSEHDSITAMLCAKFQNDWAHEKEVEEKTDFSSFKFKMSLEDTVLSLI